MNSQLIWLGGYVIAIVLALIFTPLLQTLLPFEHSTDDLRAALLSDRLEGQHPSVAVVLINENTLRKYEVKTQQPLDRKMLADILRRIEATGARGIGMDIYFLRETDPVKDTLLVDTLKDLKRDVVLGVWDERAPIETHQKDFQESFIATIRRRPVGYLNLRQELENGAIRYHALPAASRKYPDSFALQMARLIDPNTLPADGRRIAWLDRPRDRTKDAFVTIQAQDLGSGSQLANRVVLIGANFPKLDQHRTPFAALGAEKVPGVMIHAQMTADLLAPDRSISEASTWAVRVLMIALAALAAVLSVLSNCLPWRPILVHLGRWTAAVAILVGINVLAFVYWRTTFPFVLCALVWVIGFAA